MAYKYFLRMVDEAHDYKDASGGGADEESAVFPKPLCSPAAVSLPDEGFDDDDRITPITFFTAAELRALGSLGVDVNYTTGVAVRDLEVEERLSSGELHDIKNQLSWYWYDAQECLDDLLKLMFSPWYDANRDEFNALFEDIKQCQVELSSFYHSCHQYDAVACRLFLQAVKKCWRVLKSVMRFARRIHKNYGKKTRFYDSGRLTSYFPFEFYPRP